MSTEFTRAYSKLENSHCNNCGVRWPYHSTACPWMRGRKPFPAEWAASHDEPVRRQVERIGLTARLAYWVLFGVVRPVCEAFAWAEEKLGGKR